MNIQRYRKSFKKFWRRLQTRFLGGRSILVLGDSHCGAFEYCFDQGLLAPHWLNCEIAGGATAYGLNNDLSVTQAWQKFDHALQRFASFDVVVIMLGECDCSFALWKKAERLNVPPETLLDHSLAGIHRLVRRVREDSMARPKKIVLVGAILPTIDDESAPTQGNMMRRTVSASQAERTRLVLAYNEKLVQLADTLGVAYFDLSIQTMDPRSGLIDGRFVASADDHHLSNPASAPLYSANLLNIL